MDNNTQTRICPSCLRSLYSQNQLDHSCQPDIDSNGCQLEASVVGQSAFQLNSLATPEVLVPRLGEYLVEAGHISGSELDEALRFQGEAARKGELMLVGRALVALGHIDQSTLDQAVTEQISQFRAALEQNNQRLEQRVATRTAELQEALRRVTELNQLKADFVAKVSHELRTPIAQLVGFMSMMSDTSLGPLTDPQVEALHSMTKASKCLWSLIEDLLQFSEATTDRLALKLTPTLLQKPLTAAVQRAEPKARLQQVKMHMRVAPNLPIVQADADKISWVVDQLLDNAIKFTPPQGHVLVATQTLPQKVKVSVTDTGIGIPAERLQELFEPFHQLDGSLNRRVGGMGLGLTLVQTILSSHGSSIQVQSEVGAGSSFSFALPTM